MKRILIFSIVCLTSIIVSLGQSVESTILPPTGYTREVCDDDADADWALFVESLHAMNIHLPPICVNSHYCPKGVRFYFTTDRRKGIRQPHSP